MGFTPQEVDEMDIWEFAAAREGWNWQHGDNKPTPPSEEEFDEVLARYDEQFGAMH